MQSHPRAVPFFDYFGGTPTTARSHPRPGTGLVSAHNSGLDSEDPATADLALAVLRIRPGSALLQHADGGRRVQEPGAGSRVALTGLRCPAGTEAVAVCFRGTATREDGQSRQALFGLAVDRSGRSAVRCCCPPAAAVETLGAAAGPLYDMGLRALGLDTPPCRDPVVWYPDGIFLYRLTRLLTGSDAPCRSCAREPLVEQGCPIGRSDGRSRAVERLTWEAMSRMHPLAPDDGPAAPHRLRELRQDFERDHSWRSIRQSIIGQPPGAPRPLPELTPDVGSWLDDGSLARWVLSQFSHVPLAREHLLGLLEPRLAEPLEVALSGTPTPRRTALKCGPQQDSNTTADGAEMRPSTRLQHHGGRR